VDRFKVLVFTGGYLPAKNYGGPVVSIKNLVDQCGDDFQFYIVTTDHDFGESKRLNNIKDGWNLVGNANVMYLTNEQISFKYVKKIINDITPDLMYQNSFFDTKFCIPSLIISKQKNIPLLIAPRGEICLNAFKIKRYKKRTYVGFIKISKLLKDVYFQSTSDEEREQFENVLNINPSMIIELENIPSLPPDWKNIPLKKEKRIGELRMVFLSRIQTKKNLHYAIEVLKAIKSKVAYDIYGPIENAEYWQTCKNIINDLPPNISVKYKGVVERDNLYSTLRSYHVMFFPTLSENYGHAIVESMLSGCPVIISDQTPWNGVNEMEAGWALPLNDRQGFVNALESVANMNNIQYKTLVNNNFEYIKKQMKTTELVEEYIDRFNKIIQRGV